MKLMPRFVLQLLVIIFCFFLIAFCSSASQGQEPPTIKTKINAKDGLTYVWILPGRFRMGCSPHDSECRGTEISHSVTITKGFWIGQTPVTQAAYHRVERINPSRPHGDQLPVDMVSWDDANAYCEAVDIRLPTEAEYEYAARGGTLGARYAPLVRIAWYLDNSNGTTHDVGLKQANGYGLYDMLGNVWEWVADWYGPFSDASAIDPKGPHSGRVHVSRGGAWGVDASSVRVSVRSGLTGPGGPRYSAMVGFRCAGN